MYRQYDQVQDRDEERQTQDQSDMYGQMLDDGMQQFQPQSMPWQGIQGTQTQIGGRPMICYPMMYGNQMGQYESQDHQNMYRQQGMSYYNRPRPYYNRPRPYYYRPRPYYYRPRPYFGIYPFFSPYYYNNYPYNYYEDDYDYDYGY